MAVKFGLKENGASSAFVLHFRRTDERREDFSGR
jgi:hypothetical protein